MKQRDVVLAAVKAAETKIDALNVENVVRQAMKDGAMSGELPEV